MHKFWLNSEWRRRRARAARRLPVFLLLAPLTGCEAAPPGDANAPPPCAEAAMLTVTLYGSIETHLAWGADGLECSGMRRPDEQGARLRFSGPFESAGGDRRLTFIVALPELERGRTVAETPATVTLIEEDTGRFFSSGEAQVCWSDITRHDPIAGDENDDYLIGGIVYCVSPLAELNAAGGVTFTDLEFSGRIDWGGPK